MALSRCSWVSGWWCTLDISLSLSKVAGSIQRQVSQSAQPGRRQKCALPAAARQGVSDSTTVRLTYAGMIDIE